MMVYIMDFLGCRITLDPHHLIQLYTFFVGRPQILRQPPPGATHRICGRLAGTCVSSWLVAFLVGVGAANWWRIRGTEE